MTKAVFLDRDGVINHDKFVVRSFKEMRIFDGALEGLARLAKSEYKIILVTNKGSIGVGLLSEAALALMHNALLDTIRRAGGRIDAIYHCPHVPLPVFGCDCRKPKPGMILRAAKEHGIDLGRSWMVGDNLTDVAAGRAAGCRTILLTTTHGDRIRLRGERLGVDHVAKDLAEAVDAIIGKDFFKSEAKHVPD
ncbi:MAG: HAD family hydrolase [Euryarchaeota archaeon]|nr:HAD family hydrolase [Euryarchaeota archaeon]